MSVEGFINNIPNIVVRQNDIRDQLYAALFSDDEIKKMDEERIASEKEAAEDARRDGSEASYDAGSVVWELPGQVEFEREIRDMIRDRTLKYAQAILRKYGADIPKTGALRGSEK